jgi:hypothetical protein
LKNSSKNNKKFLRGPGAVFSKRAPGRRRHRIFYSYLKNNETWNIIRSTLTELDSFAGINKGAIIDEKKDCII